jgi:uncharacterized membrane protein YdjX (TVP38/TMEM64 family)
MPPEAPAARKIPWVKLAVVAVVLVVIAAVLLREHSPRELMDRGQALVDRGMALIRSLGPTMYFSAMVVLPAIGAPMLAFTVPAGELFAAKMTLGGVIAVTLVAVAANLALTYWIAHRALRPLVEGILKRYGYTIPRVTETNALSVALVVRLTPGTPFFLQGYVLAIAGVPFRLFMIVSWLGVLPWAVGAVVLGRGIMNGNFKTAGMGFGVLVVAIIGLQLLRKRFAKREG